GGVGEEGGHYKGRGRAGGLISLFSPFFAPPFPPLVHFGMTHEQCSLRGHRKIRILKPGGGLQLAADMDEPALVRWIDLVRIALNHRSLSFVELARDVDRPPLTDEQAYRCSNYHQAAKCPFPELL